MRLWEQLWLAVRLILCTRAVITFSLWLPAFQRRLVSIVTLRIAIHVMTCRCSYLLSCILNILYWSFQESTACSKTPFAQHRLTACRRRHLMFHDIRLTCQPDTHVQSTPTEYRNLQDVGMTCSDGRCCRLLLVVSSVCVRLQVLQVTHARIV